jgi:hypothetical protein
VGNKSSGRRVADKVHTTPVAQKQSSQQSSLNVTYVLIGDKKPEAHSFKTPAPIGNKTNRKWQLQTEQKIIWHN